jgi:sugar-phosphatase
LALVLGDDRRFQAALFDLDGLLVDSEPLWREVELRVFGRLGVPLTTEMCLETRGMVLDEVTEYWFGRYPWAGPSPAVVATEIIDAMVDLVRTDLVLKPGAGRALADCRARGLALAIASSSPRRLIEAVVERLALTSWFAVLHSAQEEDTGKPDPAVFLSTARLLGVAPAWPVWPCPRTGAQRLTRYRRDSRRPTSSWPRWTRSTTGCGRASGRVTPDRRLPWPPADRWRRGTQGNSGRSARG